MADETEYDCCYRCGRADVTLTMTRDDRGAVTGFALTVGRVRDLEFTRRGPDAPGDHPR